MNSFQLVRNQSVFSVGKLPLPLAHQPYICIYMHQECLHASNFPSERDFCICWKLLTPRKVVTWKSTCIQIELKTETFLLNNFRTLFFFCCRVSRHSKMCYYTPTRSVAQLQVDMRAIFRCCYSISPSRMSCMSHMSHMLFCYYLLMMHSCTFPLYIVHRCRTVSWTKLPSTFKSYIPTFYVHVIAHQIPY